MDFSIRFLAPLRASLPPHTSHTSFKRASQRERKRRGSCLLKYLNPFSSIFTPAMRLLWDIVKGIASDWWFPPQQEASMCNFMVSHMNNLFFFFFFFFSLRRKIDPFGCFSKARKGFLCGRWPSEQPFLSPWKLGRASGRERVASPLSFSVAAVY